MRLRFKKCGIFYCAESSFSNDDYDRLDDHFEKQSEVFVPNMSKKKKSLGFYTSIIVQEIQVSLWSPFFRISPPEKQRTSETCHSLFVTVLFWEREWDLKW